MLTIDRLSKTYADGTEALRAVSLDVPAGTISALIGGSGCGKTTLLRLIAGLDRPSSGRILVDDEAISGPHPAVGIVFQEPRLFPWLSVAGNTGFGLRHLDAAERRARVEATLSRVGLAEHARRLPRELSGGQQQRVAIARALIARPKVLLLDEPFSALDAFTRSSLHDHLLSLWEAARPTVLMVTHDVDEAIALGSQLVVMSPKPGRIHEIIDVPLGRPRDRRSEAFDALKRRVLASLDGSMLRASEARLSIAEGAGLWW
ncbi:MAG TPA: ABC transporter ATP-binding protein [Rhodomicrobium sp.]|nr:ABC transporter ATP-binding protein [Rhodomicrobium sp.]